jgi:myo-inositol 2-dehydrogenase/D-chiro-inositol 1-dehydrogenase
MNGEIAVAIIGTGRIARVHAAAYQKVSRGRLVACTDPDPQAATRFGADFGVKVLPDLDAVLADDTIGAVLVATPFTQSRPSPRLRPASTSSARSRSR